MMRILLSMMFALVAVSAAQAKEIEDVELDDTISIDGQTLVLNGAGVRSKFFLDVYIASLYLPQPQTDPDVIINADEPMVLRLNIISGMITSRRMADSTRDGFVRSTHGNLAPIEHDVEELIKAFSEEIEEGDVFDLVYDPATGVTVYKDGEAASNVPGLAFKKALFGIWLSDDPIQKSLKKALINKG